MKPTFQRLLVAEAARDDRQATEALFCTFGVNLGFFESQILGPTRSTGAVVTTLSDAHVFPVDTRSMASAGIAYVPAVAAIPGAFHPKVNILAGPKRAIVSIGSGNLTVDGWHNNDEVSTVFTADTEHGCPSVVAELARWLDGLPSAIPGMSPAGANAVGRVAGVLGNLAATTATLDTGHRLVHSSTTPIIDQLPAGPVERLHLYAPFHGQSGHAFEALLARLQPVSVVIALQTAAADHPASLCNRTVVDPQALARVAAAAGVDLAFHATDAERYRHGKLIEATLPEGRTWTLTGSANLSAAALLKPIINGGNCEVGIVTEAPPTSLFPPTDPTPLDVGALDKVVLFTSGDAAPTRDLVTLLSAEIDDGHIKVHLSRPAPFPVTVEISHYLNHPDDRATLGQIPQGHSSHAFDADYPGGSRVRLTWQTPEGSAAASTSERPLIDPTSVRRRLTAGRTNRHNPTEPTQFFDDPAVAAAWLSAVQTMASKRAATIIPTRTIPPAKDAAGLAPAEGWHTIDDPDTWQAYTDDANARLGDTMLAFALGGLPRMASLTAPTVTTTPDWVDRPDKQDASAEEGATIEDLTEGTDEPQNRNAVLVRLGRQRSTAERRRVRAWLATVVDTMPHVPAIDRLAMYRILLLATRGRFWESDTGEGGWFTPLATATRRLAGNDIPAHLDGQIAALAATGTYLLKRCLVPGRDDHDARTYRTLIDEVEYLLLELDDDHLANTLMAMPTPSGLTIDPLAVRAHADLITDPDPNKSLVEEAHRCLDELEDLNEIHPFVWHARGRFTDPGRAAAAILDLERTKPLMAVWVVGRNDRWAVLIRHDDLLTWVDQPRQHIRYRDFPLGPLVTPSSLAASPQMQAERRVGVNNSTPTAAGVEALRRCEIDFGDDGPKVAG